MGIVCKNIVKKYVTKDKEREQTVLNQLSFEIQSGEMVAIRGRSGAGKSTLLHILGLLDVMDSGSYMLDGTDVSQLNNKKMAKARNEKIGFILQDYGLIEEETVLYNVELPLLFSTVKLGRIKDIALEKLEKTGVEHLADKKVSVLSGGEKQRVAIARALVNEPDYIMADEPTGALDSRSARMLLTQLTTLNEKENATIMMVTHDSVSASYCKRILFIKDGKLYNELVRGEEDRKEFYNKILQVVSLLGGDLDDEC